MAISSESVDIAVIARKVEELGFESLWLPERAFMPVNHTTKCPYTPDGVIPELMTHYIDPFLGLARASAATRTLKLGTGVCLVPGRNPLVLAKEIATLDHLLAGRFIFGIGVGWFKEEVEIKGGDFPRRWSQTREAVLAMKELWTKDEAEFHGKFFDFPPVRSFPKPYQKPHPPIIIGGAAPGGLKRAAAWGDGWIPAHVTPEEVRMGRATLDELAVAAGRDPSSLDISISGTSSDIESIGRLEDAGADRVIVTLPKYVAVGQAALEELEQLAEQVVTQTALLDIKGH